MSLNRSQKAMSREHRERVQPSDRKRLGLLEKKKDWIQRTRAHQKKKNKLRKLRRNALERNRDEFDYHMVRSQVGFDGVHREAEPLDEEETHVQRVFNDVRDITYVRHKLSTERKKIEKMKATLHLTDMPKMNTHTIFVDDVEEAKNFDPVTHFGTTDELLRRKSNRLPAKMLETTEIPEVEKQRHNQYSELTQRLEREKELNVVLQKLEVKKDSWTLEASTRITWKQTQTGGVQMEIRTEKINFSLSLKVRPATRSRAGHGFSISPDEKALNENDSFSTNIIIGNHQHTDPQHPRDSSTFAYRTAKNFHFVFGRLTVDFRSFLSFALSCEMVAIKKVQRPHLTLEFGDALRDSPAFRQDLDDHYNYFMRVQKRYDESVRLVDLIIEQGQNYVSSIYNLTVVLNSLWSTMEVDEPIAKQTYRQISDALAQVVHLNKNLIETTYPALKFDLQLFNDNELSKLRETKVRFDQMNLSVNDALSRRASTSRHATSALADAQNSLSAIGTLFAHTSLDYVAQMNMVHARKHHVLLDASTWCFFRKGHDFFNEKQDPSILNAAENIAELKEKSRAVEKKMQDRHAIVPKNLYEMHTGLPADPEIAFEGYLFKRSSKTFKAWHRRYFMIKGAQFVYVKKNGDLLQSVVMEDDLKFCLVRPAPSAIERSACFELVSRNGSHILQADSEPLCQQWIHILQVTIQHLHEDNGRNENRTSFLKQFETVNVITSGNGNKSPLTGRSASHSTSSSSTLPVGIPSNTSGKFGANWLEQVKRVPGNRTCADCGNTDAKWTSLNLGVVICIECSGSHRSLGVHISKVRSLTMDDLSNDQKQVLLELGNFKVNGIYLSGLHEVNMADLPKQLTPTADRTIRERYITAKYVEKKFARPLLNKTFINAQSTHRSSSFHENLALDAIGSEPSNIDKPNNRASVLSTTSNRMSLANSESRLNDLGAPSIEQQTRTAIQHGDLSLLMRLMVSGLDINARIGSCHPLHLAVENDQVTVMEFLFLNGALVDVLDQDLNTPLHIAAEKGFLMCVYHLVKRSANKSMKNVRGETPLDLGMKAENAANIVTLLRLHDLRDADQNDGLDSAVETFIGDVTANGAMLENSSHSSC
ncbi:hypothetical protein M3Y98_00975400 [Aphelenchoides besseyi]|nr:hypothetical protein M3Y98_00975400 [Aphelenchoides besseyi]